MKVNQATVNKEQQTDFSKNTHALEEMVDKNDRR